MKNLGIKKLIVFALLAVCAGACFVMLDDKANVRVNKTVAQVERVEKTFVDNKVDSVGSLQVQGTTTEKTSAETSPGGCCPG